MYIDFKRGENVVLWICSKFHVNYRVMKYVDPNSGFLTSIHSIAWKEAQKMLALPEKTCFQGPWGNIFYLTIWKQRQWPFKIIAKFWLLSIIAVLYFVINLEQTQFCNVWFFRITEGMSRIDYESYFPQMFRIYLPFPYENVSWIWWTILKPYQYNACASCSI